MLYLELGEESSCNDVDELKCLLPGSRLFLVCLLVCIELILLINYFLKRGYLI